MSTSANPRPRSPRSGLVYGTAALSAASKDDRLLWALHRAALVRGLVPVVPAMAVAEADSAQAGLEILDRLDLDSFHYLHAARGELLRYASEVRSFLVLIGRF